LLFVTIDIGLLLWLHKKQKGADMQSSMQCLTGLCDKHFRFFAFFAVFAHPYCLFFERTVFQNSCPGGAGFYACAAMNAFFKCTF
jgi:hypothetical protein